MIAKSVTRTDGIIFQHGQRLVGARPPEGSVVACHGHGDEADGYGAGFGCLLREWRVSLVL